MSEIDMNQVRHERSRVKRKLNMVTDENVL